MSSVYRSMDRDVATELATEISDLRRDYQDLRSIILPHMSKSSVGGWNSLPLINGWTRWNAPVYGMPAWRVNSKCIELRGVLDSSNSTNDMFTTMGSTEGVPMIANSAQIAVPCRVGTGNAGVIATSMWVYPSLDGIGIYRKSGMTWVSINVRFPIDESVTLLL
jgi:hypothetical protein